MTAPLPTDQPKSVIALSPKSSLEEHEAFHAAFAALSSAGQPPQRGAYFTIPAEVGSLDPMELLHERQRQKILERRATFAETRIEQDAKPRSGGSTLGSS